MIQKYGFDLIKQEFHQHISLQSNIDSNNCMYSLD
jgi:hypothetical protein